jgi:3-oxoadipate enol-lactonase
VHFCGLSLGGMVGQWLGVHAPDRLASLTLCNTAAHIGPAQMWDQRIANVLDGGMETITEGVLARWFTPAFLASSRAAVAPLRQGLIDTPAAGYAACCAAVRDMDLRERAGQIDAPTLVIAGSRDEATPPADGRLLADRIPGAEYHELDAAHLSNVEQAEAFTSLVLDFVRGRAAFSATQDRVDGQS